MKHTQGKWIVQNDGNDNAEYIYCEETTQWICQMNRLVIKVPKLEQERRNANAELIAKAPAMYEALRGNEDETIPTAQLVLVQAMLGDFDAVKTMLRDMCSVHAKATGGE